MSTVSNSLTKYSKYLIDSSFKTHSYEDVKRELSSELFKIILSAEGWDEGTKEQIIENEIFFSEGYVYTISLPSTEDQIMWIGADISVTSIDDGAATFAYAISKPTKDIIVWVVRGHLDGEVIVPYTTNEIILNNYGEVDSYSMSVEEMIAILEG